MDDRAWMYTGRPSQASMSYEWIEKTDAFLELAFAKVKGARATWCPCSRCANTRRQTKEVMGKHLCKFGFTANYTRWIYHGEADRMREEVVRPRVEDYDGGTVQHQIEALQAQLEEERRRREQIEVRMEADRQRMEQMYLWMQSLGESMGRPPPPELFPPPPPEGTPNQSVASNDGPRDPPSGSP